MNITEYDSAGTVNKPSIALWKGAPSVSDCMLDPTIGYGFFDDFIGFGYTASSGTAVGSMSRYAGFASSATTAIFGEASTVTGAVALGGQVALGSDGDDEGASLQLSTSPFQIIGTSAGKKLWFEARIKTSTITNTKHGFLIGLGNKQVLSATVPIAAAGTLDAGFHFAGFWRPEGDGDGIDACYVDAGSSTNVKADAVVPVADTWMKLGLTYDPSKSANNLQYWYNGAVITPTTATAVTNATIAALTNFDIAGLAPIFAVLNATASTPGYSVIDWWKCVQER